MIIVQKFGGTSLMNSKQQEDIAKKVKEELSKDNNRKMVIVVSAMGRKGEPYATDTLLSLLDHYKDTTLDKKDLLMSCGETISASVLGSFLDKLGIKNKVLTGWNAGIITDSNFSNASIKAVDTEFIEECLENYPVVVVTGFQGKSSEGELTTLGRGGSDVTAVALGIALKAEYVEIYTDVEGIMTADPRVVPDAQIIEEITYQEVFHMANDGAKVIHPRAVEMAMHNDIDLWVKSMESQTKGTKITHHDVKGKKWEIDRFITGVTSIDKLTHFRIYTEKNNSQKDLQLLEALACKGISLDLISITPCIKAFVVEEKHTYLVIKVVEEFNLHYEYIEDCTKVTVIGVAMKGKPGVMAKILHPLTQVDIPIIQTSDSHINISLLVEKKYSEKSVNALHKYLITKKS